MSQCARLLDRLERGPITPMEAWNELGVYRLAARVANRFGESCRVARYSLEK